MQFCDEYCYIGQEFCQAKGIYSVNYSGYHKVCESHIDYLNWDLGTCGYCQSTFIISPPEIPNQTRSAIPINAECPNCSSTSPYIELSCSHIGCLSCENEGKCRQCKSSQKFCKNCPKVAQNIAVFECRHDACFDCIYEFCKECKKTENRQNCSRCQNKKNLCLEIVSGTEKNKCQHPSCFNCIAHNKKCLRCEGGIIGNQKGCINCEQIAQNDAYFECKHNACFDCIQQFCKVCQKKEKLLECSRCQSRRTLCLPIMSGNIENICQHLSCFGCIVQGEICLKCQDFLQKPKIKHSTKCPNCGNEGIPIEMKCGHIACHNCDGFEKCANCWQQKGLCINDENNYQDIYSFDCGHLPCKNCLNKHCTLCNYNEIKNQTCSRCNRQKFLLRSNSKDSTCSHNSCYNCFLTKKNCTLCSYNCPNCGKIGILEKIQCGHIGCNHCVKGLECANCWQKKGFCINDNNEFQKNYSFGCKHLPCHECLNHHCELCNNDEVKQTCPRCNEQKILLKRTSGNSDCIHDSCYNCISNKLQCKLCRPEQPSKNIELKKKTEFEEQKAVKNSKNSEIAIKRDEELPNKCNKCKKSPRRCQKLNCGHNICASCLKTKDKTQYCPMGCRLYTCNSCKTQKICFPCELNSEYICLDCFSDHRCACMECDKESSQTLECNHLKCDRCSNKETKGCTLCLKLESACLVCLTKNEPKVLLNCKHIGCQACHKQGMDECFDCLLSKSQINLEISIEDEQCFWCGNISKSYLTLVCGHHFCESCCNYNWKIFNYSCYECVKTNENRICYLCLKIQELRVNDDGAFTECCDRPFPYY